VGPFIHNEPRNRPLATFGGRQTLHFAEGRWPWIMLPVIPER
jgi:hypothetical protein